MVLRIAFLLLGVALIFAAPATVIATTLVASDFSVNDEGWRVGTLFSNTDATIVPFYLTLNNGVIETAGLTPFLAFEAPAKFRGDESAAYGGSLEFDVRIAPFLTQPGDRPLVVISDGTTFLQFRATTPPLFVFVSFDVPLLASAGWQLANSSGAPGPPATEAQLQAVLGSLKWLRVEADWNSDPIAPDDIATDLDNVRLVSAVGVPEPASIYLMAVGFLIVGVGGAAVRRHRAYVRGRVSGKRRVMPVLLRRAAHGTRRCAHDRAFGGLTRIIGDGTVGRRPTHRAGFRFGFRRQTGR